MQEKIGTITILLMKLSMNYWEGLLMKYTSGAKSSDGRNET